MSAAPSELNREVLVKRSKSLRNIAIVVGVIALLYVAIYAYWMFTGQLDNQKSLGLVPFVAMMVSLSANLAVRGGLQKQIAALDAAAPSESA